MTNRASVRQSAIDRPTGSGEDYQRLLLEDLLYFFPGPYAMLHAYMDESGTHGDSPVVCVAALLYSREQLQTIDLEWKDALEAVGIRYFHAVDSSHRDRKSVV